MWCSYYYTLIDSHQFPHLCCLYHNILVPLPWGLPFYRNFSDEMFLLLYIDSFRPVSSSLLSLSQHFESLYPEVFFLSEFLRWDVLTIIHWFIPTSFLIFVVFITTFWSISLRPSFYLNSSDEMFLLLYIDSFPPVSSSLLSLSQHFGPFTLRPSFYQNFSDEMFLLLYIDSFPPVSSFLLSLSQHFALFTLRSSFYLNFSDEMFLLLYIDSFTPVSSFLLSLSQHFGPFTLRLSFYLNFSDEMFLQLYIDSFRPVSSSLLSLSQHFESLYPEAFFLSEFLRWDVLTIIHWLIPTSFLIFVVFITTFWSISLRPSFYLNFSDEVFLLLYIDWFPPVSSSLLSWSQHFGPFP